MSYFADNYDKFSLPVGKPGFRQAQAAAIHALTAHFYSNDTPAIVVMPTGAGKTAVAAAVTFTLRARRVLIITPSRLLREQITEKFETLVDLERIGAVPPLMERPRVKNLRSRVKSPAEWNELESYNVVVTTVFSITGLAEDTLKIPEELFDLVIVDEAHHTPAATWSKALDQLSRAKQILLTATPFRRDARRLKGRIVFSYDVKRAYEDGVFGDLTFRPVEVGSSENADSAIARETESQFLDDRKRGYDHLVMVRVDGIDRGKALEKIYQKTSLRLKFISGSSSLSVVNKTNKALRGGELDGIICVNMFGEGFDLSKLKIAALHSPHKSLAVTLQFIGRFARTTDTKIGRATFVAIPKEQRKELRELWTTSAIWPEIVHNISSIRIEQEKRSQEIFDTFDGPVANDIGDIPLTVLRPYFHAKVFQCGARVQLDSLPVSQRHRRLRFYSRSKEFSTTVFVEQYVSVPKWLGEEKFEDGIFHLSIIFQHSNSNLLFIGATDKTISNYERLLSIVKGTDASELSSARINKALNGIEGLRFFNLGMRRKQFGGRAESYRILSGPSADNIISELDGQSYNRGHSFGKGRYEGKEITIGISTSSKIWSNFVGSIPEYVDWCSELAARLSSKKVIPTGSGLDKLSTGQPISAFTSEPIVGFLNPLTFLRVVRVLSHTGEDAEFGLLTDFDLTVCESNESTVHFRLQNDRLSWDGVFRLTAFPAVIPFDDSELQPEVGRTDDHVSISEYLSELPPQFLLKSLDQVVDGALFEASQFDTKLADEDFEIVDWRQADVNIQTEKPPGHEIKVKSVFDWMEDHLDVQSCSFIFNDDGAGEVADFITIQTVEEEHWVSLYHCKASGASSPGSRLDDLYDVCGQAIRSGIWLAGNRLFEQLQYRAANTKVAGTLKGSLESLRMLYAEDFQKMRFANIIVQPGISRSALRERPEQLVVTTKHSILAAGFDRFRIIGSA